MSAQDTQRETTTYTDMYGTLVIRNPDCWITPDGTWGSVSDLTFVSFGDDRITHLMHQND